MTCSDRKINRERPRLDAQVALPTSTARGPSFAASVTATRILAACKGAWVRLPPFLSFTYHVAHSRN